MYCQEAFPMIRNFNITEYVNANPEVKQAVDGGKLSDIEAYLETTGFEKIKLGQQKFHPDFEPFDEAVYLNTFKGIQKVVDEQVLKSGFDHFCKFGYQEILEGRRRWLETENNDILITSQASEKMSLSPEEQIEIISRHFDEAYYREANPQFATHSIDDLLLCYFNEGSRVGHKPNSWFDPVYYRQTYNDVDVSGLEPLVHFILVGYNENRAASSPDTDIVEEFSDKEYKIKIENCDQNLLRGWVIDVDNPNSIIELELFVDDTHMLKFKNDQARRDLERKNVTDGLGGFKVEFQQKAFSDGIHNLSIVLPNGKQECMSIDVENIESFSMNVDNLDTSILKGWILNDYSPNEIVKCDLYIDDAFYVGFENTDFRGDLKKLKMSNGRGGFKVLFPKELFTEAKQYKISIVSPDKQKHDYTIESNDSCGTPIQFSLKVSMREVTVVVPIYNAADDVEVCIERLLAYTSKSVRVILIDDASPDEQISKILDRYKSVANFTILTNDINLGFTKTVNRGIKEAGDSDVIFLNSDARVTPRWIEGMRKAAYSDMSVGTVTAMSDRAGAFSAPKIGNDNDLPDGVSEIDFSIAFRRRSKGLYPTVPTGNGFCMYVRRDLIDEIGPLDEIAFPRGYGEENDFCMRARKKGWRNIIDDRTYVYHDRNKSFLGSKTELIKAGRSVVDERYPDYGKAIRVFNNSPLINAARYFSQQALQDCLTGKIQPRGLYVVATQSGGTPQTNKDLMTEVQVHYETWVLQCDSKDLVLTQFVQNQEIVKEKYSLKEEINPLSHTSSEYDIVVLSWLEKYEFSFVHIRHSAWHSLTLPKIVKAYNVPVIYSFHDYYTLCPTIKLIDDNMHYCAGECSEGNGQCSVELWSQDYFPQLKNLFVHNWREKFKEPLSYCDAFITTSESSKRTIMKVHRDIIDEDKFHVIRHGRDFDFTKLEIKKQARDFHILVPGNISEAKGWDVIGKLLEIDHEKRLFFHILGKSANTFEHERLIQHGAYKRDEFANRIADISPIAGAVLSIWNETWCHTLTELWSVGLPVIVFDFETVASRVKESNGGWVYEYNPDGIKQLYENIIQDLSNTDSFNEKLKAVYRWQEGDGKFNSNKNMSKSYMEVYEEVLNGAGIK